MSTEKKERLLTPVGFAKWAHIHKPKDAFDDKGEPKFQIEVAFDPANPEWKPFIDSVASALKAMPSKIDKSTGEPMKHKSPIKRELDQNEQLTGRYIAMFKTGAKYPPNVFDRYGKTIQPETAIGNESKVRVSYTQNEYEGFGGGVNLYLGAVQVLELVAYQSRSADAYGFDVEPEPAQTSKPDDVDQLPF